MANLRLDSTEQPVEPEKKRFRAVCHCGCKAIFYYDSLNDAIGWAGNRVEYPITVDDSKTGQAVYDNRSTLEYDEDQE